MFKRLSAHWAKKGGLKYQVTIWVDRIEVIPTLGITCLRIVDV